MALVWQGPACPQKQTIITCPDCHRNQFEHTESVRSASILVKFTNTVSLLSNVPLAMGNTKFANLQRSKLRESARFHLNSRDIWPAKLVGQVTLI